MVKYNKLTKKYTVEGKKYTRSEFIDFVVKLYAKDNAIWGSPDENAKMKERSKKERVIYTIGQINSHAEAAKAYNVHRADFLNLHRRERLLKEIEAEEFETKQMELLLKISKANLLESAIFAQAAHATTTEEIDSIHEELKILLKAQENQVKSQVSEESIVMQKLASMAS